MGIKDWSNQNWDSFKKDWKSGTGYISDQLKSANGWIDQNLRSFEKGWKKFFGKSDPETRKLSLPQFSDFQASNGCRIRVLKAPLLTMLKDLQRAL